MSYFTIFKITRMICKGNEDDDNGFSDHRN